VGRRFFSRFPDLLFNSALAPADEFVVISLKKYLDAPDTVPAPVVESYRALLATMGECGSQVCPPVGAGLQASLLELQAHLAAAMTPTDFTSSGTAAEGELRQWGARTADYYRQKAAEIKELMMVVARTAESVGERDLRYTSQFSSLTARLRDIADLEDLTKIRSSLLQSATELKNCVDQMTRDNQESLTHLRAELTVYRDRLEESERLAAIDPLTGIANRRKVEQALDEFVVRARPFCIMLFDLNSFKQVNDQLGHASGDDLLRQFATELRLVLRNSDLAGRWGGDEFIALLDCGLVVAESLIARIRDWVFGEYTVHSGSDASRVKVSASVGLAAWVPGEKVAQTIQRADSAMYREKAAHSKGQQCRIVSGGPSGRRSGDAPPPAATRAGAAARKL